MKYQSNDLSLIRSATVLCMYEHVNCNISCPPLADKFCRIPNSIMAFSILSQENDIFNSAENADVTIVGVNVIKETQEKVYSRM